MQHQFSFNNIFLKISLREGKKIIITILLNISVSDNQLQPLTLVIYGCRYLYVQLNLGSGSHKTKTAMTKTS